METIEIIESSQNYAGMILLLSIVGVSAIYLVYRQYKNKLVDAKSRHLTKQSVPNLETDSAFPTNVMAGSKEFAAIAAVIHLYSGELHDKENTIMTINKIARAYSPWCSKLYFQNQYFNLRRR